MSEVVFEMISVAFEDVEALVFDFPPGSGASGDLGDGLAGDGERGDEGAIIGCFAAGIGDGHADPVDVQSLAGACPGGDRLTQCLAVNRKSSPLESTASTIGWQAKRPSPR